MDNDNDVTNNGVAIMIRTSQYLIINIFSCNMKLLYLKKQ